MDEESRIGSTIPIPDQEQALLVEEQIIIGSSVPIAEEDLAESGGTLQRLQARNQELQQILSCRICRQNRIRHVFECGHLVCTKCSEYFTVCPFCEIFIQHRCRIQLYPAV